VVWEEADDGFFFRAVTAKKCGVISGGQEHNTDSSSWPDSLAPSADHSSIREAVRAINSKIWSWIVKSHFLTIQFKPSQFKNTQSLIDWAFRQIFLSTNKGFEWQGKHASPNSMSHLLHQESTPLDDLFRNSPLASFTATNSHGCMRYHNAPLETFKYISNIHIQENDDEHAQKWEKSDGLIAMHSSTCLSTCDLFSSVGHILVNRNNHCPTNEQPPSLECESMDQLERRPPFHLGGERDDMPVSQSDPISVNRAKRTTGLTRGKCCAMRCVWCDVMRKPTWRLCDQGSTSGLAFDKWTQILANLQLRAWYGKWLTPFTAPGNKFCFWNSGYQIRRFQSLWSCRFETHLRA